jgi:uncharacterized protein (DUF3820 family)
MAKMTDESILTFGKYKGEKLANVPASYLIFLFENDKCNYDLKCYIEENEDLLYSEIDK